jgi:hypothetical protein
MVSRIMRLAVLTIICTGLVLTLAATTNATGDRGKPAAKCPTGHMHLVAADAQAEVYVLPPRNGPHGGYEPRAIYGCAYAQGHAYALGHPWVGSSSGGGGVAQEVLAGTIVAYEQSLTSSSGYGNRSSWLVYVRDLRNGKVLHEVPTGTPNPSTPGLVGAGFTTAIVVKTDGAVAWIVEKPLSYEVHAVDATGSRVLASGPGIERFSLALAGSTLYWTQGGMPFSAPLD